MRSLYQPYLAYNSLMIPGYFESVAYFDRYYPDISEFFFYDRFHHVLAVILLGILILLFALTLNNSSYTVRYINYLSFIILILLLLISPLNDIILNYRDNLWFNNNSNYSAFYFIGGFFVAVTLLNISDLSFIKENKEIEFPMLILMGFLATLLLVGSTNLISVFISLECLAFLSYVLVAFERSNKLSVQAGVRYLFLGAVPTGLFVLGIVETYSFLGTFNLDDIYALTFGTEEIIDEHNSGGNSHTSKIFDADVTFAAIAIQKFHEAHSAAWHVGGYNLNLGIDDNIIFGVENIGDAYLKTELDDALGAFESYVPIKTPGHISEELISYAKLFYFDEEEVVMKRIQIKPQGFGIELLYDVLLAEQFQFEQQIAAQQLGSEAVRFMKESVVIANE
jgi:hypothetical protein